MSSSLRSVCFVCIALCSISISAQTPGTLDTSFGNGGIVITSVNGHTASGLAHAVAVQPDGKIVVAAASYNYENTSARDFYVLRYDANGLPDPSFGSGGVVRFAFDTAANNETPYALALQTDGKILVGGPVGIGADAGLARLNSNGTLDSTFGTGGKVKFVYVTREAAALNAIAVTADGRIVVAGGSGDTKFALARFNTNGSFDNTFNGNGKLTVTVATKQSAGWANGLAIQADGKYVASGRNGSTRTNSQTFTLLRVNVNGTVDTSFGSAGLAVTNFGGAWSVARKVAIDATGKIVAGGDWLGSVGTTGNPSSYVFVRYLSNGQLDPTFGTGGKVILTATTFRRMEGMAIQSDGKIVGAGWHRNAVTNHDNVSVVRIEPNGSLDNTFGTGGFTFTNYNGLNDQGKDVAIQPDGKIVVAGLLSDGGPISWIGLLRYLP